MESISGFYQQSEWNRDLVEGRKDGLIQRHPGKTLTMNHWLMDDLVDLSMEYIYIIHPTSILSVIYCSAYLSTWQLRQCSRAAGSGNTIE